MKIMLITGMLASGKSIALRVFQDLGYYCIDNLPPSLIIPFLQQADRTDPVIEKIGLVLDARSEAFFSELDVALDYLKKNTQCEILYVDANDEVLIQRYKLMRRKHLMANNERIEDTICRERKTLEPLRIMADYVLDTSYTKDAQFKTKLLNVFAADDIARKMMINVVSFGFKYGILKDADLVFDVRFLPNPYYVDELRALSGEDERVKEYVFSFDESKQFNDKLLNLLNFLMPFYRKEGKSQLIVGIGCSGGRHRSVAIADRLAAKIVAKDRIVTVDHRDIYKEEYVK